MKRITLVCCLLALPFMAVNHPPALAQSLSLYPTDPTADTNWSAGTSGVADIQAAFNNARNVENAQLGTSLPTLTLPSQSAWDALSDGQKALWLINRERLDRGVKALSGVESNVTGVAQAYAKFLIDHNLFGHYKDGHDPLYRLNANPAIGACHDFLGVAENLAAFYGSSPNFPLSLEQSIYMWMYEDSLHAWGHRHAILWYPYNDNSGPAGQEGFLGIGRYSGSPYLYGNYGIVVVMNIFDPCATWNDNPTPPSYPYKVYLPLAIK